MTTEVDANYFRTGWVKSSLSSKSYADALPHKETSCGADDARYEILRARIQRLHESFDAWCADKVEAHGDVHAVRALTELNGIMAADNGRP